MSSKNKGKSYFPNRRSAVISITVVVILLIFALFAIDQNNVSRLQRYEKEANESLAIVTAAMDERFAYSRMLIELLEDEAVTNPFTTLLDSYAQELSPSALSLLYTALDKELALLQKKIFTYEQYPLYASYFEKIYEAEKTMTQPLNLYNEKARFLNAQMGGFVASFAAKRLKIEALELFSVAPALKGRP